MKQFGQLLLAAVLGSALTFTVYQQFGPENSGVKIEHLTGVPTSSVAYTVNESGELEPLNFTETAEMVTNAVVHIRSTSQESSFSQGGDPNDPLRYFFGPRGNTPRQVQSSGSGVIISEKGYIVTNNHVVRNADLLEVTLSDNRTFAAEVIGTDEDTDLAVIKISQEDLPYLSFVDSDNARVGEWVLAVGNPFNLTSTVTAGIISAKGRNINIINSNNPQIQGQPSNTAIESFIQTDAAINPGNSGGALVDLGGGLLGINTAIASNTGSYAGYGFAVPSNIVSKVVEDIIAYGSVQRGWLGVEIANVTSELVNEYDLSVNEGAYISGFGNFEGSAAETAGVKEGDVVVKLDNAVIKSSSSLIEYIGRKRPGDKINVVVNRNGKLVEIPVTLKSRAGVEVTRRTETVEGISSLGMELEDLSAEKLDELNLDQGVRVSSLANGRLGRFTDMREGFIITHVDDKPVKSAKEVNQLLASKKSGDFTIFSGIYEGFSREYNYVIRK